MRRIIDRPEEHNVRVMFLQIKAKHIEPVWKEMSVPLLSRRQSILGEFVKNFYRFGVLALCLLSRRTCLDEESARWEFQAK